jgi:glycosyltransferase involved in cell wall biosynthesis
MIDGWRVGVVIPALNEERAIGRVIADIPSWVDQIVVADNASTDQTADAARKAGAIVVSEPERGYGAACQKGISTLRDVDIVVFIDGDYSDVPSEMALVVLPIVRRRADLVIGSRVLGNAEMGALTPQQVFGNRLSCWLIARLYSVQFTDLGPFRAIRMTSLSALGMKDRNYGWTVEMQIKAARLGLSVTEVPVSYRRRIGVSKISGTLKGTVLAGATILSVIARSYFSPTSSPGRNDSLA